LIRLYPLFLKASMSLSLSPLDWPLFRVLEIDPRFKGAIKGLAKVEGFDIGTVKLVLKLELTTLFSF
jgi:hypothetical protein